MAFIKQRGKTYYVVYKYLDKEGRSRQKWEAFPSKPAAERRLKEVDYKKAVGTLVISECMNLAFACTMRISEILGLTWDCIDITDEAVREDRAYLYINKQIQRVNRSALEALDDKDVIKKFVPADEHAKSIIVLKTPKTQSSIRKVFLPKTVAGMLSEWKAKQEELKEILGSEYEDNNLVICSEYGGPVEENAIKKKFDKLIRKNGLRKVVFHSIRHTSITYKLRLTGGDVKAVQGDSGHAQTSMVTDVYSHILDENRIRNAEEVEAAFYSGKAPEHQKKTIPADTEDNMKVIANLLQNKELMAVIKTMMG